ncbi:acetoacetate--CoA ligase [Leptospira sp. GIMC2001]|uniref:acetoacetate--CoA ligase n=1 Tax=Leptospira sp. GIMC2001 TaxID=1513297 RepID=UPI00234A0D72|nr:acetoacetate--CoA ligase [Leptospira sp. GIMC2001]WCL50305.1 acetoacetate--CoA ligase [Leptospira sp. GIMC2001]
MNQQNPKQIPLWSPNHSNVTKSQLTIFQKALESSIGKKFSNYHELWKWSTEHVEDFWQYWAEYSGLIFQKEAKSTWTLSENFYDTEWFPGSEINFAENLLRRFTEDQDRVAIHFQPESSTVPASDLTRRDVLHEVKRLQDFLIASDIIKGDRIAGILPNSPVSILSMLATTSLGAIWSSASPDFGTKGLLDRFQQIDPKILILCDGYFFKGKKISCLAKWKEILDSLPSVEKIVIWNFTEQDKALDLSSIQEWTESSVHANGSKHSKEIILWNEIPSPSDKNPGESIEIQYTPIHFNDPVYIMYSSGTTGLPKCIVQGPGVLLNHTKELILHTDLVEDESITYYTTCGWMMWNWVASSLYIGSRLCIFDGNPFYPDWRFLWEWIDREKIHVFGISAKYLTVLDSEKVDPKSEFKLQSLRAILSTGSPLPASGFEFVYNRIKSDIQLSSISGGTDLNGCFALGNPTLPVYSAEIQCRGLGMAVHVYNDDGQSVLEEKGELVCEKPFPSMPLYFWKDKDRTKYKDAYFSRFENIWCHGDFAEITATDGMIIYGRSDATLNPGGVRIGTADIYNIIETFEEIQDSVIIGQDYQDDVRIVLFVKMKSNYTFSEELVSKIKKTIRDQVSPRHMPAIVLPVTDIPYTVNGKKVELAVKNIVEGKEVKNANALSNPECLAQYRFPELQ